MGWRARSRAVAVALDERAVVRRRVLSAGRATDVRDRVLYAGADGDGKDDCAARRRRRRAAVAVADGRVVVGDVRAVLKKRRDSCMGGVRRDGSLTGDTTG